MPASPDKLLTDAERHALAGLWFTAARPVEGLYAGRHRSPLKGHSTEFYDYRPYAEGDPLRNVDWKLFGRTDRLYVRRYRHDAELAVHLIVDASASMDFKGIAPSAVADDKWLAARKLAAAVAHLVIAQQDRVSLTFMGERAIPGLPLGAGWQHHQRLCELLTAADASGAAMPGAPQPLTALSDNRGLIVLISDLMDDPAAWLGLIGQWVHQRRDVAVFQVLHPDELALPFDPTLAGSGSSLKAIDSETGQAVLTAGLTRQAYAQRVREHVERLRQGMAAHGVDHQLMRSDRSVIHTLARYVSARTASGAGSS